MMYRLHRRAVKWSMVRVVAGIDGPHSQPSRAPRQGTTAGLALSLVAPLLAQHPGRPGAALPS